MNEPAPSQPYVIAEPDRAEALRWLWNELEPDLCSKLCNAAFAEAQKWGPDYWAALVGCQRDGSLAGTAWVQPHAGRAASMHGPVLSLDDPLLAADLAGFCVDRAAQLDLRCIQALLPVDYTPQSTALTAAGFRHIADLLYMFSTVEDVAIEPPKTPLALRTATPAEAANLIEQTYRGSLDCPEVDGLRTMEDVLAGYRATGDYHSAHWQIVSNGLGSLTCDVGCLILADHPATDQMELVYMGIVPEARGSGWGAYLVRHAQWRARDAGRQRLVLAVDAANQPAVRMYAASGFTTFDCKTLWLRPIPDLRVQISRGGFS